MSQITSYPSDRTWTEEGISAIRARQTRRTAAIPCHKRNSTKEARDCNRSGLLLVLGIRRAFMEVFPPLLCGVMLRILVARLHA